MQRHEQIIVRRYYAFSARTRTQKMSTHLQNIFICFTHIFTRKQVQRHTHTHTHDIQFSQDTPTPTQTTHNHTIHTTHAGSPRGTQPSQRLLSMLHTHPLGIALLRRTLHPPGLSSRCASMCGCGRVLECG